MIVVTPDSSEENQLKTILTLAEFKDPLAGNRFQKTGELLTPLGSTLVRSDDVANDLVLGLDNRFAVEEVITQPLIVEYDKVIEQRFEEAVISVGWTRTRAATSAWPTGMT